MLFEGNPNRGKKDHELFFSQMSWSGGIHFFHKSIHIFPLAWNLHVTRTMEHFIADLFFSVQLQKWASAINTEKEIKMGEGIDTRHQLSIGWNFELDGIDHYPYYECYTLELANSHTFLPLNLSWACSVRSAFLISCVDDGLYFSKISLSLLGISQMSAISHYCDINLHMGSLTI